MWVCALAACGAPRAAPHAATAAVGLRIVGAELADGDTLLRWPLGMPVAYGSYALIDDAGYAGTVRVVGPSKIDCDDCGVTLLAVTATDHRHACRAACVAVGPVNATLSRARIAALPGAAREDATWQTTLEVDVDGDGRWDLDAVARCGGTTPSGCSGQVCNRLCTATRVTGRADPEAATVSCVSFVPDVDDCTP